MCPLAHEASAIRRGVRDIGNVRIVVSGPGAAAVRRTLEAETASPAEGTGVLLAGVAGALCDVPAGFFVRDVVDAEGARFTPSLPIATAVPGAGVTLLGLDSPLSTPAEKRGWHERTGAALVDMESHAFARVCAERGIPWGVVRGVSDGADETLDPAVLNWVTPGGGTRALRPVVDILRKPRLLPVAIRLARRSGAALPVVARQVAIIARAWTNQ